MPPYAAQWKWLQNYFDVITLTQDYRKEKEESNSKETMALEVVTDRKHDKTGKNDEEYVHNKITQDGTCVLFWVPPSFM